MKRSELGMAIVAGCCCYLLDFVCWGWLGMLLQTSSCYQFSLADVISQSGTFCRFDVAVLTSFRAESGVVLSRQVTETEGEATKKTEERAKLWKVNAGSNSNSTSPNTTPSTSVEIVPKDATVTSSKAETSQPAEAPEGADHSHMSPSLKFQF